MLQRSVKWFFWKLENGEGGNGLLTMAELHSHKNPFPVILVLVGSSGIIAYCGRSGEGIGFFAIAGATSLVALGVTSLQYNSRCSRCFLTMKVLCKNVHA